MQSEQVSKERYCLRYCLVKQRTVCTINVWGYTEILPCKVADSCLEPMESCRRITHIDKDTIKLHFSFSSLLSAEYQSSLSATTAKSIPPRVGVLSLRALKVQHADGPVTLE